MINLDYLARPKASFIEVLEYHLKVLIVVLFEREPEY